MDLREIIEGVFEDVKEAAELDARQFAADMAATLTALKQNLVAAGADPREAADLAKREAKAIAAQRFARATVRQREILVSRAWSVVDLAVTLLTGLAANGDQNDGADQA